MLQTAQQLALDERLKSKTIVLTGAFKPERFVESDASFNVGLAIGALQVLHLTTASNLEKKGGVYVAMNGMVFAFNECEQNSDGFYVFKAT